MKLSILVGLVVAAIFYTAASVTVQNVLDQVNQMEGM